MNDLRKLAEEAEMAGLVNATLSEAALAGLTLDAYNRRDLARIAAHNCNPPCDLMRIDEARRKRPRMTKAQLIAEAALGDEAWVNQVEELDMANAYMDDLRPQWTREWFGTTLRGLIRAARSSSKVETAAGDSAK